jgi:hypothetical protein
VIELSEGYNAIVRLRVFDGTRVVDEVVDLPATRRADDIERLVVVRIDRNQARVGATPAWTDDELVAAARQAGIVTNRASLLRIDDEARLGDVLRVARAMRRGGFEHVILGTIPPDAPAPPRAWDECSFPGASWDAEVDTAVVTVVADDDGHGSTGAVTILTSPGTGFAYAAAVCVAMQRLAAADTRGPRYGARLRIRFTR